MNLPEEKTNISFVCPISIFGPAELFVFFLKGKALIELHENFQKRTIRSRTRILSANGPQLLVVPLQKGKTKLNIRDVKISYDEKWYKDYLQGIRSAYANSPYFEYYFPLVQNVILKKYKYLIDLFNVSFSELKDILGFDEPGFTEEFIKEYDEYYDLRNESPSSFIQLKEYVQVFSDRFPFQKDLSILDTLFNMGPETISILKNSSFLDNSNKNRGQK